LHENDDGTFLMANYYNEYVDVRVLEGNGNHNELPKFDINNTVYHSINVMPLESIPYRENFGFCYSVDAFFLLGCYVAYFDNCLLTFQDSILVPSSTTLLCFILGDGTDRSCHYVSK
jgi:hypothetical protein